MVPLMALLDRARKYQCPRGLLSECRPHDACAAQRREGAGMRNLHAETGEADIPLLGRVPHVRTAQRAQGQAGIRRTLHQHSSDGRMLTRIGEGKNVIAGQACRGEQSGADPEERPRVSVFFTLFPTADSRQLRIILFYIVFSMSLLRIVLRCRAFWAVRTFYSPTGLRTDWLRPDRARCDVSA